MSGALRTFAVIIACIAASVAAFSYAVPGLVDVIANRTRNTPPYEASPRAHALLARIFVADLHADTLLWSRDPGLRNGHGHVDVPRLVEGGVALQAFTLVTKVPLGLNIERNRSDAFDLITPLAIAQRWPRCTWGSALARALYQASRLRNLADLHPELVLIRTREDFVRYDELRRHQRGLVAGFLGIEGAQALEGDLHNIDVLFGAGIRMIGLAHFFDTELAGSAHGDVKSGLTSLGRAAIERMEQLGIVLDLAHASPAAIDEATTFARRPVVVSHTGVKATCDNTRNLDDARLRAVAATGGVVGIGFWETAVCGTDAEAITAAIHHAVDVAGVDHVGLGSDFDGAVEAPFDVTGLVQIVDGLLARGYAEAEIAKIMGGNAARVISALLPSESEGAH